MNDFHKLFPHSGVGKQYPWLLEQLQLLWPSGPYSTQSVLDYGAGKGGTADWLEHELPGLSVTRWDPYVEAYSEFPNRYYDCVYSCDVLEHIPRKECVERGGALAWINSCTRGPALLVIDLTPAKKTLPDGANAHVNLQTPEQWIKDIEQWMRVQDYTTYDEPDKTYGTRTRLCVRATRGKKM